MPRRRRNTTRTYGIVVLLSVALVAGIGSLVYYYNPCRGLPYPTVSGQSLAEHNHAILQIYVNDRRILIPYGVGEGDGPCAQPLHNHADAPEVVHIESTALTNFSLAQYFNVWSKTPNLGDPKPVVFNSTQIFSYKTGNGNELRVYVNGQLSKDYQNLIILQHMTIVIVYGESITTNWASYQTLSAKAWPHTNI